MNNLYNFKNPVRHFLNIDNISLPIDITTFPINELCWTQPISFRIKKDSDKYRTLKLPNILNFVRAYHYYNVLPNFNNVNALDYKHKRLNVNIQTGDFVSGEFDKQLNDDFTKLCLYDFLLKVDISEYYGKIYTHYLNLNHFALEDRVLSSLNFGKTSGLIMGNYISLYFAEYLLSKISADIDAEINKQNINCKFNYFSDDFYFFCNENDIESLIFIFDKILEKYDFIRNEKKKELWNYEKYNSYNILTRYWKATIRQCNLDFLKDCEKANSYNCSPKHRLTFLNQLIYRLSSLTDTKSKRTLVNNFFKTKYFQEIINDDNHNNYIIKGYDYHQLCFLLKLSPEALLYTSYIFNNMLYFNLRNIKPFLQTRYEESLSKPLNDEQLYYYFALKCYNLSDILQSTAQLVIDSNNQILISYYLKDDILSQSQKNYLKQLDSEDYWFQNYHLILFCSELLQDLETNIEKYLIPKKALSKQNTKLRYMNFYKDNIVAGNEFINDISVIIENIKEYLSLRHEETALNFDEE